MQYLNFLNLGFSLAVSLFISYSFHPSMYALSVSAYAWGDHILISLYAHYIIVGFVSM